MKENENGNGKGIYLGNVVLNKRFQSYSNCNEVKKKLDKTSKYIILYLKNVVLNKLFQSYSNCNEVKKNLTKHLNI